MRLELTRAGVQEVLSLYSQEQRSQREEPGFSIRLADLERAVRERRRMLVWGLVAGVATGLAVLLTSTPLYPVSAQVVIERRDPGARASNAGSAFVATQAEVLQSRSVVASAVETLPRPAHLEPEDDPVAAALEAVRASPVSGTQVVALGYLGPDPDHGVRLLEAIVASYRDVLRQDEIDAQQESLRAKQAEIRVLDEELAALEERLAGLRLEHGILGTAEDTASAQTSLLRDLSRQLADVRNERIALENRLATGGEQLAILDPATRSLQEQLWEAQAELSRVQLSLKPRHPAVEAARREVEVLERQLAQSARATPEALKRDIAAALGLERQLLTVYEQEQQRMATIEQDRREETLLLAELERVRALADTRRAELLDQRLQRRLAEAGEVGVGARLIEAPMRPEGASWPKPIPILGLGAALGLTAGFVAALISLRREQDAWESSPQGATAGLGIQ